MTKRLLLPSILSLTLAAAAPLSAQEATPTLEQLLETHARWRGGRAALLAVRDLVATGQIETAGLKGRVEATRTRDGQARVDVALPGLEMTTVVGPAGGFRVNASGQVEPLPESALAQSRFANLLAMGRHFDPPPDVKVSLQPSEPKDDRTWAVVRFEQDAGPSSDLFLDPADGSLAWIRTTFDRRTTWTRFSDWRLVGELRWPFHEATSGAEASDESRVAWQDVRFNTGVAAERFARPEARRRLARFADAKTSSGWLPIELYLDRYIYLRGTLNGVETDVVLDSGAGATVVDAAFADQVGLKRKGNITARGVGGTQSAALLDGVELVLGPLTFSGVTAVRIDMSSVTRLAGRGMPVILGKEAFQELIVDVDYPNARVAFHDPKTFRYEGSGKTVRLHAGQGGHRTVEASIEGKAKGRFTVDTGSGGTVTVFAPFVAKNDLLVGREPISQTQEGGVGGLLVTKVATLRSFELAGFELAEVPATFTTDAKGGAFDTSLTAGNLGAGIFGRFRLIFDYSREALHVEPGPDWDKKPFAKDRFGLRAMPRDGKLVVTFVAPGSPAAKDGWSLGDTIQAIDGQPADEALWRRERRRWLHAPAGTEVVVTDGTGKERKLVAADYY